MLEVGNDQEVDIKVKDADLKGSLYIPQDTKGLVIFSHGAGSNRLSPRNRYVSEELNKNGFATLLFDLLTEDEDQFYANRFDIELLTQRLTAVTDWISKFKELENLDIAFFGASTGAASALKASARINSDKVITVISRGGRPDMAFNELKKLKCPVLLMVGSLDTAVLDINYQAAKDIENHRVKVINGASHLFTEPGTLIEVAQVAVRWLNTHF